MKKLLVYAAALLLLAPAVVSCNQKGSKNEMKSQEDSLATLLGETWGYGVAGEMKQGPDSAKFDKNEFLKGLELVLKSDTSNMSFVQGLSAGMNIQNTIKGLKESRQIEIDADVWLAAFKKAFKSDSLKDPNSNGEAIQRLVKELGEKAKANDPKALENKKAGEAFIAKVAKEEGVKKTSGGIYFKVVKEGEGEKFKAEDVIKVKYEGKHVDGTVFDNGQGQEVPMSASRVIPGMAEALQMMSPGAHYILYIPSDLAYGVEGGGPIGPNETLIFDVETVGLFEAPAAKK